jgi:hypothetical protein
MNLDEEYRAWKDRPLALNVPPEFAGDIMRRVHQEAGQQHTQRNWPGVLEFFQRNVAFRYAALAVAAFAGLTRLWLIFFAILQP